MDKVKYIGDLELDPESENFELEVQKVSVSTGFSLSVKTRKTCVRATNGITFT